MATANEVTQMIDYLNAAFMLPAERRPTEATIAVYIELLGDVSVDALRKASRMVVLNHKFATFPSVAELRDAAVRASQGEVVGMTAAEAWGIAWKAAGKIDPDIEGSIDRHTAGLPEVVVKAMRTFGMRAFVLSGDSVEVMRAQFMRIFDQLAQVEHTRALLPAKLATAIESGAASGNGAAKLPAVVEAAKRIGVEK